MTIKQESPEYGLFQQEEPTSVLWHRRDPGLGDLGLRAISRRSFIGSTAGAAGVMALGSRLGVRVAAASEPGIPTPIPHASPGPFGPLHFFFPGPADSTSPNVGHDPSVINNFNGFVGQADLTLTGTGTDTTTTGVTGRYMFHTDMRFMKGEFVGADGENHHGAFAFI